MTARPASVPQEGDEEKEEETKEDERGRRRRKRRKGGEKGGSDMLRYEGSKDEGRVLRSAPADQE